MASLEVSISGPNHVRTLFGFARQKKRRIIPSNYKPGLELMNTLRARLKAQERPPAPAELAGAFVALFESSAKLDGGVIPLEDVQLAVAIPTFKHLQSVYEEEEDFGLSDESIRSALNALRSGSTSLHVIMATLLFDELTKRRIKSVTDGQPVPPLYTDLSPYISILCQNGAALLARDLVESNWHSGLKDSRNSKSNGHEKLPSHWMMILRGLIRERRNSEVDKTVEMLKTYDVPFDSKLHQAIISFYAHYIGDLDMTKKWYNHPIANSGSSTSYTDANVLKLCIRKNDLEWGDSIFKKLLAKNPDDKASWSIILQWCAANGKGVDEVEEMMKVMLKRSKDRSDLQPDMEIINALIEYANSKHDPYTAERYYGLGQKWGFEPNARTFFLQLDYRLKVNDLSGALDAYNNLQSEVQPGNEDIPYVNKLIVALCTQSDRRYDTIIGLVEDLRNRKTMFHPETVAALALMHIQRNEMQDYSDLLHTYIINFSSEQRKSMRDALLKPIFAKELDPARAWQTYTVLQDVMPESLDRKLRVDLMQAFFDRGRGDMGLHAFGHMRKDKNPDLKPTLEIYCQCLEGLAKHGDPPAVQLVHNMMTMDDDVEPNTRLRNALILAYTGVDKPGRGQRLWDDILASREGPSYNSVRIAMQAAAGLGPWGEKWANAMWDRIKQLDIEVTRELFADYIGAMGAAGIDSKCWKLLANSEKECGSKVDALM